MLYGVCFLSFHLSPTPHKKGLLFPTLSFLAGNHRVVIAAISMGSPYFTAFMSSGMVSEEWKAANVAGFLSVSGEDVMEANSPEMCFALTCKL